MAENRLITPKKTAQDEEIYNSIRPQCLADFTGQKTLCENYFHMFLQGLTFSRDTYF